MNNPNSRAMLISVTCMLTSLRTTAKLADLIIETAGSLEEPFDSPNPEFPYGTLNGQGDKDTRAACAYQAMLMLEAELAKVKAGTLANFPDTLAYHKAMFHDWPVSRKDITEHASSVKTKLDSAQEQSKDNVVQFPA